MDISALIEKFMEQIVKENIELYNEDSVQYELAFFLRQNLKRDYRIQLERNINYFGLDKRRFLKKEMDIVIFNPKKLENHCIEIKFPTAGQHPEQMFSAIKDVKFLEQLVSNGFSESFFIMFASDPLFYSNKGDYGIYASFRRDKLLTGKIRKPTGRKDMAIVLDGKYKIQWNKVMGDLKYFVIAVNSESPT
jgi:hypothetical protein